MTAIVSGIYAQGKLELLEVPVGIHDGKVRVIVIEENARQSSSQLPYGKYHSGTSSTESDFAIAEWRPDQGWGANGK